MRALLKALTVLLAAVAVLVGVQVPAVAAVPVVAPVTATVAVSGPVARLAFTVTSSVPAPDGRFGVSVAWRDSRGMVVSGDAWSVTSLVRVGFDVPASLLPVGALRVEVEDLGGPMGLVRVLTVRVERVSRVTVGPVVGLGSGRLAGLVRVSHYSAEAGGFVSSQGSPVWVERQVGRGWVRVGCWVSGVDGVASGVVVLPVGVQVVRVVRPQGVSVGAVVSGPVRVVVV